METTREVEIVKPARYHRANEWPDEIPRLTRVEAERAAMRLAKVFGEGKFVRMKVRRCWVPTKPPFNKLHRGWRRLVHDMSHRIHEGLAPTKRPHDWRHEWLEGEMVKYVIAQGWLTGKLRPAEKPKVPAPEIRYQRVLKRLETWQSKLKRAETAIKKLQRQKAYYERQSAA